MATTNMYRATSAASGASNLLFDEIKTGQSASAPHTLSKPDVELLAFLSGRVDALQLIDGDKVQDGDSADAVAGAALLSALLQRQLPGPGTIYLDQHFRFWADRPGRCCHRDRHRARKAPGALSVAFACTCVNQDGKVVIDGTALVIAPTEKIKRARSRAA